MASITTGSRMKAMRRPRSASLGGGLDRGDGAGDDVVLAQSGAHEVAQGLVGDAAQHPGEATVVRSLGPGRAPRGPRSPCAGGHRKMAIFRVDENGPAVIR